MTREEFLKMLIKKKGYTIKEFASHIGMPYTTLLSMLNGSIGGAAVESVIKICLALGISVETLQVTEIPDSEIENVSGYYLNPETAKLAQEIHDDPDLRILLDASRDLEPEDIKFVVDLVKKFKKKELGAHGDHTD